MVIGVSWSPPGRAGGRGAALGQSAYTPAGQQGKPTAAQRLRDLLDLTAGFC
jgi:hypothetical protein